MNVHWMFDYTGRCHLLVICSANARLKYVCPTKHHLTCETALCMRLKSAFSLSISNKTSLYSKDPPSLNTTVSSPAHQDHVRARYSIGWQILSEKGSLNQRRSLPGLEFHRTAKYVWPDSSRCCLPTAEIAARLSSRSLRSRRVYSCTIRRHDLLGVHNFAVPRCRKL
jgi:hypothetical protein